ncbi:efflux RND transporter periplasmic adaptor subunit [Shewanella maritima]|uniref:efflux RND transporter periplasmic adaptor subunit n=1 Tax=Shewanella maritima TaxID=2520507 RepID=UPI0037369FC4
MKPLSMAVFAMLIMLTVTGCNTESKEVAAQTIRPVKLMEVTHLQSQSLRVFPAKVAATKQAELAFRISGHLVEQSLFEGQSVKQGDLLARLDDRDAQNALLNYEADFALAKADYQRTGELLRRSLVSQAEFDLVEAKLKSAQANLSTAKDQLSYTELHAPYDGTIAKTNIENFQMVQANQTILTIQKDANIDVVIQIPESLAGHISQLAAKQIAQVRFSANPAKAYDIELKEYATQVTPGTQSYQVVFTLARPTDLGVLPGMSAEVSIDFSPTVNGKVSAVVPLTAVSKRDLDGQHTVWIFDPENKVVNQQAVNIGNVTTDGIEITSGIKVGDQVVVAGVQYLSENQAVKPLRWQRGV